MAAVRYLEFSKNCPFGHATYIRTGFFFEITSTKPRWKSVCVYFSFVWFVYIAACSLPGPTQYIFHTPMARYSLSLLKVPLNTKQANKLKLRSKFRINRPILRRDTGKTICNMASVRHLEFAKFRFFCQMSILGMEICICLPNLIQIG